jgi:hypothetical protein
MEQAFDKLHELPPGTVQIKDVSSSRTILVPKPSSDPNQPLVSYYNSRFERIVDGYRTGA